MSGPRTGGAAVGCCLALAVVAARAQDTRTVTEPVIANSCAGKLVPLPMR